MSSSGLRSRVIEMATCPICQENFIAPRSLPCVHSFCLHCLQGHCKDKYPGDSALCPLCREEFQIPRGGVEAMPVNFLQNLVEARDLETTKSGSEKACPTGTTSRSVGASASEIQHYEEYQANPEQLQPSTLTDVSAGAAGLPQVPLKEINVLLIGATGVGKSTWINAVANYLKFDSLEDAVRANGLFPIPSKFLITHPQTGKMIQISSEGDGKAPIPEDAEVGESVTKMPNEHILQYDCFQFNLIDTPGLMDTQDTSDHSKDKEHVNNILRLLSTYNEIHAICILLDSTKNRLNEPLKYTLTEILRHLDKGASHNVIFIFTCASTTNFKPSKTQAILEEFLKQKGLDIPLPPQKATIYCFENSTVECLAQCKNEISQDKDDDENARRNWKKSQKSITEMFDYICKLTPHSLAYMNAIYNAEHTIGVLSRLVLEMSKCSFENIAELERKKKEAEDLREKIERNPEEFANDDLKKVLVRKEETITTRILGYENVVCTSSKCTQVVPHEASSGVLVIRSHQRVCCERCKSPVMYFCSRMNLRAVCKVCGCGQRKHEWRVTEEVTETREVICREKVIGQIVDSNSALKQIDETMSQYNELVEETNSETEEMLSTCAQLNSFVQHSVLMASSDVDKMSERLQDEIDTHKREMSDARTKLIEIQDQQKKQIESRKGQGRGTAAALPDSTKLDDDRVKLEKVEEMTAGKFKNLQKIQAKYNDAKDKCQGQPYSIHEVDRQIRQLYTLPTIGRNLRECMEIEEKERRKVVQKSRQANKPILISIMQRGIQAASKVRSVMQNITAP